MLVYSKAGNGPPKCVCRCDYKNARMLLFIGIVILVKTLEYWSGLESRKKLNLTQLCFTHPIVPCPFSGLFLICELTAEAFFLLSY